MAGLGRSWVSEEGETVEALVWRALGTRAGRIVERVLDANVGLAALGPVLPAGTRVMVPELPAAVAVERVRLWD